MRLFMVVINNFSFVKAKSLLYQKQHNSSTMALGKTNYSALLHAYFLLSIGAVLITIFLASIIQGVMVQVGGNFFLAIGLYLVAWFCLGTGAIIFLQGKKLVHLVMISG